MLKLLLHPALSLYIKSGQFSHCWKFRKLLRKKRKKTRKTPLCRKDHVLTYTSLVKLERITFAREMNKTKKQK